MSSKQLPALFSSAGRRVELIECFRRAATLLGYELIAVAADVNPALSAACHISDQAFSVPKVTDASYGDAILEICYATKCRLLVPTIDPELEVVASLRAELANAGAHAVVSDRETVAVARDKARTADVFARIGVRTPRTATPSEVIQNASDWRWPVFVKPRMGSSSNNVELVVNPQALAQHVSNQEEIYNLELIVQERLEGVEYTVNVFIDQKGQMRCAVPHRRFEVRGGEVSVGRTERIPALAEYADRLTLALPGARGPLCFQAFVNGDGVATVFEINARFGGGYPLADYAGAPFALWLLEEIVDLPCSAHNDWRGGVTMLRYDTAVYDG